MGDVSESVRNYLDGVTPEKRRRDAETLLQLMTRITGESPRRWGSVIGFGQYHYKYASGREGDSAAAGFAPRKAATTIYLADGIGRYDQQLRQFGPHTTGVGCLYIKDLDTIDLSVLEAIIAESYRTLSADTYPAPSRRCPNAKRLTRAAHGSALRNVAWELSSLWRSGSRLGILRQATKACAVQVSASTMT
jgi:hypothetical protein